MQNSESDQKVVFAEIVVSPVIVNSSTVIVIDSHRRIKPSQVIDSHRQSSTVTVENSSNPTENSSQSGIVELFNIYRKNTRKLQATVRSSSLL